MRRVLFVATIPGTLRSFLAPFARHFRAKGWRVDGMAREISERADCVEIFNRTWDVDWSRNPLDPQNLLDTPGKVRRVVEQESYDLVHVHTPVAAFVTRYALRKLRRSGGPKVIYTAHGFYFYKGGPLFQNAFGMSMEKLAGWWTDYLVVINREDEDTARRYRIVPPERLWHMPGIGVDTEKYKPEGVPNSEIARVRDELMLSPSSKLFLVIAEFIPRKRHQDALRAFARLKHPQVHLALAGHGPTMEPVHRLAAELGISDRVHFLGWRQDIPALIRASEAILLPSSKEGLPRSILEAMSLAVPAIGSDIRGTRDLLEGGSGVLVGLGEVEELAAAMTWVLDNPEEARAMGQRGRERVVAQHDFQHILALHEELYKEALGGE